MTDQQYVNNVFKKVVIKRLQLFADAVDDEVCNMYCWGKCVNNTCIFRLGAQYLKETVKEND